MSYEKNIQRDLPYAYYSMDNVETARPPLVWAGNGSAFITNQIVDYYLPVFGNRKQTYAVEVWFKPLTPTIISILGHEEGDGLIWSDNYLIYETWIGDQKIVLSHYAQKMQNFHVFYVYTENSVALYVNGELSDSHEFSAEEKNLAYYEFNEPEKLITKGTGNPFILDAIAFYANPSPQLPTLHYQFAQPQTFIIRNAAVQSAETFELNTSNVIGNSIPVNLNNALKENVAVAGNVLTQEVDETGAVLNGSWTALIPTNGAQNHMISYKSSRNVSVKYSYNGNTFSDVLNNYVNTPTQQFFILKITMDAEDRIELSDLAVYQYANQNVSSIGGMRTLSLNNQSILQNNFYPTISLDEGVVGTLNISGTESATTVEFWMKANDESAITSLNGTQTINNGAGWYPNDWNHVVVVGSVPNSFTIGKDGSKIAIINIYVVTPDIDFLYKSYFGKNVFTAADTSITTITDNFVQYGYTWSVITA